MTIENIDNMIRLCRQKKEILLNILDLTKDQGRLIADDNLDDMETVLQSKQKAMEEIDILDLDFLRLYNEVKGTEEIESISNIDINKYSNLKDLKNLVASINSILDEISALDTKNTVEMRKNLKIIQKNIRNVKDGKKAYNGYNKDPQGSMLIDEKK